MARKRKFKIGDTETGEEYTVISVPGDEWYAWVDSSEVKLKKK